MAKRVLGLDIGTNSIGWSLLEVSDGREPNKIVDCGVRIFLEAVVLKTRVPKNQQRRQARGLRRLYARRRMRRASLLRALIKARLLPNDDAERSRILLDDNEFNPYLLRAKGLDSALTPTEFGRVLYHICRHRGFKSNRKAQFGELLKDKEIQQLIQTEEQHEATNRSRKSERNDALEEGQYQTAIRQLSQLIEQSEYRTLGEFLFHQPKKRATFITERSMYEQEFEALWKHQQSYYPSLLIEELKVEIFRAIFFQRPLRMQKFLVGRCSFEPTRKRAPKALLEYQEFRILQDLNNLRIIDPLSRSQRQLRTVETIKLASALNNQKTLSWNKARRLLELHDGERFNLENTGRDELLGNRTEQQFRAALPNLWEAFELEKKKALVTDVLTIQRKDSLYRRLRRVWMFTPEQAYAVCTLELEAGYASLSLKAVDKLLPKLREGMAYHDACQAVGYQRDDQVRTAAIDYLPPPPNVRNPVVQKALYELRKVTNAIIRTYGKPNSIHIELARDMKLTKKQKLIADKQKKENEKQNKDAVEQLQGLGIKEPDRDSRLKYRLWKETKGVCPYTGTPISMNMLFGPEVDIDHIIPYSRSLDDSYMNKTICLASENRHRKRNQTPYEAYSGDPQRYQTILQTISDAHMPLMPHSKRNRFEIKEVDTEKFVNRQLSDTRYVCLEVKNYLRQLGSEVQISKGEATAALRYRWGLNRLLNPLGHNDKSRGDHRHHTIDATVIALTSRALFHQLSQLSAQCETPLTSRTFKLTSPWPNFYDELEGKLENIVVSHSSARKLSGALHESSAYGLNINSGAYVYRKLLNKDFEVEKVDLIIDNKVRNLVRSRLAAHGDDPKKAFATPVLHLDGKTPIKKVRVHAHMVSAKSVFGITENNSKPYKFFKLGNNHHVEILENRLTKKRTGRFVTTLEAARRLRKERVPAVNREAAANLDFVMALSINDMVRVDDGDEHIYRVQKLSDREITLRLHSSSDLNDKSSQLRLSANSLRGSKVFVDPIGRVFPCRD